MLAYVVCRKEWLKPCVHDESWLAQVRSWECTRRQFVSLFTAPPSSQSTHNSSVPPLHLHHSSNIAYLVEAKHCGCNGSYWYGMVTTTVHSENITLFLHFFSETIVQADHCFCTLQKHHFTLLFFLRNYHLGNIVGQDQEF
jgi:hypothetical protein